MKLKQTQDVLICFTLKYLKQFNLIETFYYVQIFSCIVNATLVKNVGHSAYFSLEGNPEWAKLAKYWSSMLLTSQSSSLKVKLNIIKKKLRNSYLPVRNNLVCCQQIKYVRLFYQFYGYLVCLNDVLKVVFEKTKPENSSYL